MLRLEVVGEDLIHGKKADDVAGRLTHDELEAHQIIGVCHGRATIRGRAKRAVPGLNCSLQTKAVTRQRHGAELTVPIGTRDHVVATLARLVQIDRVTIVLGAVRRSVPRKVVQLHSQDEPD